jgi:hypothetical protein
VGVDQPHELEAPVGPGARVLGDRRLAADRDRGDLGADDRGLQLRVDDRAVDHLAFLQLEVDDVLDGLLEVLVLPVRARVVRRDGRDRHEPRGRVLDPVAAVLVGLDRDALLAARRRRRFAVLVGERRDRDRGPGDRDAGRAGDADRAGHSDAGLERDVARVVPVLLLDPEVAQRAVDELVGDDPELVALRGIGALDAELEGPV